MRWRYIGPRLSESLIVGIGITSLLTGLVSGVTVARAQAAAPDVPPPLTSLKDVQVPEPENLGDFVVNRKVAIALGKALFWDIQVGSDGQACASCHFHAGADNRTKNQLNPNFTRQPAADLVFDSTASGGAGGPNYDLVAADFPFHRLANKLDRNSDILFTTNDVASSQGTYGGALVFLQPGSGTEECAHPEDIFHVGGKATRKVEPRNTPTTINAVFNFRNFWDGRANNVFNGVNPFGRRDPDAKVLQAQPDGTTAWVQVDLRNSSLASQAVGPPLSGLEMSCDNKTFPLLGMKLLRTNPDWGVPIIPLYHQAVHHNDSVLAEYVNFEGPGLTLTYAQFIQQAFDPKWWSSDKLVDGFTQMEVNFSLFWGLAVQLYEATLISDETPFDRFVGDAHTPPDPNALTDSQKRGKAIFEGRGRCINCHNGPEFTSAATHTYAENRENGLVERMIMGDGGVALYDLGFYNIGVVPTRNDLGVGGLDPFGNPLSFTRQFLDILRGNKVPDPFQVDPCTFEIPVDPANCSVLPDPDRERTAVDGAFKTPGLRNIWLLGPYFHTGGVATLEQVVEFYNRGGNRRGPDGNDTTGFGPNGSNLDPDIQVLGLSEQDQADLVAFLRSLTDRRVRCEMAPFDHPQLEISNGHVGDHLAVTDDYMEGYADDEMRTILAVGARGLPEYGLPCLKPFLR